MATPAGPSWCPIHVRPPRCDGAGYVDEIVITSGAEEIARHRRSYGAGDFVFNPLHYLPLLEQKVGALDQVAPLQGRDLPTEFTTLRWLLERSVESQEPLCRR